MVLDFCAYFNCTFLLGICFVYFLCLTNRRIWVFTIYMHFPIQQIRMRIDIRQYNVGVNVLQMCEIIRGNFHLNSPRSMRMAKKWRREMLPLLKILCLLPLPLKETQFWEGFSALYHSLADNLNMIFDGWRHVHDDDGFNLMSIPMKSKWEEQKTLYQNMRGTKKKG